MPHIIPKNIPKTKTKSNNIPITNLNLNASATPTMVTIIIAKLYDIPVTNTFQYPSLTHITFP